MSLSLASPSRLINDGADFCIQTSRILVGYILSRRVEILVFSVVGFFTYFIFFTQFLLDNHAFRMPWLAEGEQVQNGRWMGPAVGWLHYGANVPVVMPGLSLLLTIASIFVASHSIGRTGVSRPALYFFGLLVVVCPLNLSFYYYGFMSPIFFFANFFATISALLLSKFSFLRVAISSIVILIMFATYQAAVGVLAVLVLSGVIWRSCNTSGSRNAQAKRPLEDLIEIWGPAIGALAATIAGLALYIWSIQYLPDTEKMVDLSDIGAFVARISEVSISAFRHLMLTQPDILNSLNTALGVLLIAAALTSFASARRNFVSLLSLAFAWPLSILATKAIFFISDPGNIYQYRYNSGLIYLYGFGALILLQQLRNGLGRIAATGLALFVVVVSAQADLVRQHVLMRGQERDLSTFNRILYRIESLDEFERETRYDLIRVGALPRYRLQLLRSRGRTWDEIGDGHMDYGEISDLWVDDHVFGLLGSSVRLTHGRKQSAREIIDEGLLEGREPWPAASSVFIDGERIVIYIG